MTFEEILNQYKTEQCDLVCEPPAYLLEKQQGEYTVEDFFNTPEGMRVELLNGTFIYLEAPYTAHQQILGDLQFAFRQYIRKNGGNCMVLASPNVQLQTTDETVLIPDLIIVCDKKKVLKDRIAGAPDLVVEVLSKSTQKIDREDKFEKYKKAGVREYWMIDLKKRCVLVHCFFADKPTSIYGLQTKVPVGIYKGDCVIDFGQMMEENAQWYVWEEES